jgi:hypothetical protein
LSLFQLKNVIWGGGAGIFFACVNSTTFGKKIANFFFFKLKKTDRTQVSSKKKNSFLVFVKEELVSLPKKLSYQKELFFFLLGSS